MKTFTIPFFNKYRWYILAFLCVMPWFATYFTWKNIIRNREKREQRIKLIQPKHSQPQTETGIQLALTRSLFLSILIRLNKTQ